VNTAYDRSREDVSNIVHLEHVNVTQPDQRVATSFYVAGLGCTRDPYVMVGIDNMWINIGRQQMHLPTGHPQRIRGTIGLVVPDLAELRQRLERIVSELAGTQFAFADGGGYMEVICPWGNRFRCHAPAPEFGETELAMVYVEFDVPSGAAEPIARFYAEIIGASSEVIDRHGSPAAAVCAGRDQRLYFRETSQGLPSYDGHHVQIYMADFSGPYRQLLERELITRETDAHEWRFRDIVDPRTNHPLFTVEHEVRSLKHPLYGRALVNRNPAQTNRAYLRGQDAFRGIC
jgi:predicted enzyme related to lactoylglutathione lyase